MSIAIWRFGGGRSSGIAVTTRGSGRRLVEATALSLLGQIALPAAAQDELEQVVVTGSRIARPDYTSASPIVSVAEEFFQRSGSRTVETALNALPQFVPAFTSTSNNPGNGGQANISLRGLGPTSTLVLLDGRRLMPANGDGVPDLNIIPSALIESVEIITGGASAVYGSDALAGVVNFKLRREFDGVEVEGSWGQTDRGDGTHREAGLTAGTDFAGGRGSVVGFVGYADRELVTNTDREFSKYALAYLGPGAGTLGPDRSFLPFGSRSIEEGTVSFPLGNAPSEAAFNSLMTAYGAAVPYQLNFGFNDDGSLFTQGAPPFFFAQVPAVANYRYPRDPVFFNEYVYTYNFAPSNALQLPLERKSAFLRADFELSDSVRVYAQALYADYEVNQQAAPTPLLGTFMPVTNPLIPADLRLLLDSRPDPGADFSFQKRLSELGPRVVNNQYDVYQATLGLSGEVFDDWQYDVYAQMGANDQTNHQTGNVLTSRIEELTFAPDGGASICSGGFDPFGLGSISPECLDYVAVDASNRASVDQTIVEASLSGPVFAVPAGDLRVALGAFYKEDQYEYAASPVASVFVPFPGSTCPPDCRPDIQGFNASDDVRGDDHNLDIYVEALVPLLGELRGVESLEVVFGYRLSDYESAGSFDSWKTELLYQPIESIRLRSSYQQAVRAASVLELYLPQLPAILDYFDFPDALEPCEVGSAPRTGLDAMRVEALCLAQGVPLELLPSFRDSDGAANGVSGGNPDLGPEEASTTTVGVVWTPRGNHPLLASLQVSLDWYRIDIADRITLVPFIDFASFCYDAAYNPEMSVSNRWCSLFERDATTGEIEDVRELSQNAYDWQTDGVDMQVDWRVDVGPGQLGINWLVSWIDSITIGVGDSTAPAADLVGSIGSRSVGTFGVGSAFPEWKSSLHVSYAWQDLTLGAGWRYVDSMTDGDTTLDLAFRVPHVDYFDLDSSYVFSAGALQGLELRAGVENLTDEDPPIFPSFVQANTDPSQYDVFGRRYYASLRYSF